MSIKKKYAFSLALFIIGMLIVVLGAYVKLLGWQYANLFFIAGMLCEAVGLILLIRILYKKLKDK